MFVLYLSVNQSIKQPISPSNLMLYITILKENKHDKHVEITYQAGSWFHLCVHWTDTKGKTLNCINTAENVKYFLFWWKSE